MGMGHYVIIMHPLYETLHKSRRVCMQELWPTLQAEVRGMLDSSGVTTQYPKDADMFMWHVFGVCGRQPDWWFAARTLVRDGMQYADRHFTDMHARTQFVRHAMVLFMTNSLGA